MPGSVPQRRAQQFESEATRLLQAALAGLHRHDYDYAHNRIKMALDKTALAKGEATRAAQSLPLRGGN